MDGQIDLSAGLVPKPQAPPAAPPAPTINLSAGLVPVQKPAPPQPAQDAITASLMDNPKGEGVYHLKGPAGVIQVPYSKVRDAAKQNYFFANSDDLHKYARDYAADPINETAVDRYLDTAPWWDLPSHTANLLRGAGTGALKTFTAFDRPPTSSLEQNLQLAAAKPGKTTGEAVGDLGENVGEFFTGEELLNLVGKGGKLAMQGVKSADQLKEAQQVSGVLSRNPLIAKLLRLGVTAAKTGTISGAQTYAKTGGDTNAALGAAAMGFAGDLALGGTTDLGRGVVSAVRAGALGDTGRLAQEGAEAYGAEARRAIQPHLENINSAVEKAPTAAQGSGETGLVARNPAQDARALPGATSAAGAAPQAASSAASGPLLDVDHILNQVHDFTGAADRLTEVNKAGYETLEQITGKKFRDLNDEVQAAQKAMWRGQPGAEELYQAKQGEMDKLIDSTKGAINRETVDALKQSWRQSYMLRDFGRMWDKAVSGVPGASKVSTEQRGLDGKVLMRELQGAVRRYGRFQIDRSLGPGRLEVLEQLAQKTMTKAGRVNFYTGIRNVARSMERAAVLGGVAGHFAGNWAAGAGLAATAAGAVDGTTMVLNAIKTNPKIAQNFLFALDSGASAEHYAPFISTMIQKMQTDDSQQQRQEDAQQ